MNTVIGWWSLRKFTQPNERFEKNDPKAEEYARRDPAILLIELLGRKVLWVVKTRPARAQPARLAAKGGRWRTHLWQVIVKQWAVSRRLWQQSSEGTCQGLLGEKQIEHPYSGTQKCGSESLGFWIQVFPIGDAQLKKSLQTSQNAETLRIGDTDCMHFA